MLRDLLTRHLPCLLLFLRSPREEQQLQQDYVELRWVAPHGLPHTRYHPGNRISLCHQLKTIIKALIAYFNFPRHLLFLTPTSSAKFSVHFG